MAYDRLGTGAPTSTDHLLNRLDGGPTKGDGIVVEVGGRAGREGLSTLESLGLYKADGRMTAPLAGAEPGSEARLRGALEDLGLSHGEIEDFLAVSRMLARISPEAARRLEEGLRAIADTAAAAVGAHGSSASPADRLGDRQGYALDYMRLEFSYTGVTERVVHNKDGTLTREVSSTQVDLTFERMEVAFRGKADDMPAILTLDGDELSFGPNALSLPDLLTEIDVEAAGLQALLAALEKFQSTGRREEDADPFQRFGEEFGLKRLGEGVRAGDDTAAARSVDLLFG
jgi:hypothetical protein